MKIRPLFIYYKDVVIMFMDSDFDQIGRLLQRACEQCLLTRKHCENCNVSRLHGIIEGLGKGGQMPSYLVPTDELAVLTDPVSPQHITVSEKWRGIINKKVDIPVEHA
ncbi:MAG: hypothetical protein JL50_08035 [Peptococcaceae bacterium BICA1-7]|nr:MAG: hypothetical protein JL50_08035 [Peptococcaceae bacterium BICA1-7]HBV97492.1 hypothetical protein [Desulfotomaculum sp.]